MEKPIPFEPVLLYTPMVIVDASSSTISDYDELDKIDAIPNNPFLTTRAQIASPQASQATSTERRRQKYRVLTTPMLVGIVYFISCGGPVGSEPVITAGGPLLGLVGLLVYTSVCLIPLLFAVTELSCSFPDNGGYAVWTMTAFGPYWGFQSGYWSWLSSVFNSAIYPGQIYTYVANVYGIEITSGVVEFLIKVSIAILLTLPNYFGVRVIGVGSLVLLLLVMAAVLTLTIWSTVKTEGSWYVLKEIRSSSDVLDDGVRGVDWTLLINNLMWSFDGMYSISVVGGEIVNPAGSFPRVMAISVVLFLATYLIPWTFILAANKTPWQDMTEGSLPDVAGAIGGTTLRDITLLCSAIGSVGLFTGSLFNQSFLVQGMAQARLLPSTLRKRSARFKVPLIATHVSCFASVCLVGFDFENILDMTNAFSAMLQILIVLSAIQIRRKFPHFSRPWRVPGTVTTMAASLVPVTFVFCFLIYTTFKEWEVALIGAAFIIPGLVFPLVRSWLAGVPLGCC